MEIIDHLKNYRADYIDVTLTKTAVFGATLFLAKVWNPILNLDWYWYLIICLLAAVKPMVTFYRTMKL